MDEGIAGSVAEWDERPLEGGLGGVHRLADREFSGAIEVGGTWLLMINGRAVGVFEEYDGPDGPEQEPGDPDRLADGAGTVYEAPYEGLPLLYAMVLSGGEERGRYYTGERPLRETHQELADGGFTGYVELSEEVVSGDYYVVYQGGRSMSVAFVGGEGRLRTDDAAFERADEEIGIYTVTAVDLDVVDLPEPVDDAGSGAVGDSTEAASSLGDPDPAAEQASSSAPGVDGADEASDPSGDSPDQRSGRVDPTVDDGDLAEASRRTDADDTAARDGDAADAGGMEAEIDRPSVDGVDQPAGGQAPGREPAPAVRQLEARVDALAAEQERLAAAVETLRADAAGPDTETDATATPSASLDRSAALEDTTVLVRYRSDGGATLEAVGSGAPTRETLRENLQLEVRTPFDADAATVEGRPFRSVLEESLEYRFVEWLVAELPFDVREAGAETALGRLNDALPAVDRATFGPEATVGEEPFDLVAASREGDPLVVATFEDGVEPPTEAATEAFVRAATTAAEAEPSVAAAALVTPAYVDGAAIGPAREATRGSLLGRNKRNSFVRLSGGGFHLCLVEAGESFHLAVPEL